LADSTMLVFLAEKVADNVVNLRSDYK
jgi:hypothetical protein